MAFRRFQNFQIGALTSARLNEMQDAILRLQARVDRAVSAPEAVKDRILARITGVGTVVTGTSCQGGVPVVAYPFSQVFVTIAQDGAISATTCITVDAPEDALSSTRGAYLIRFEEEASLEIGSIVNAQLSPFALDRNAQDKQQVYIVSDGILGGAGEMRIATLTQAVSTGIYKATLNGDNQAIDLNNLYETQGYYGAGSVTVECATLTPGTLAIGSVVWASKVGGTGDWRGKWITMTPVPFSTECTCGELGQPLQLQGEDRDKDAIAVGIISRMMGAQ